MLLADLVATSAACAATRARTQKIALLADAMRQLDADEVEVGVGYLAGQPRQERLEVGWAALSGATAPAAAMPTLRILDVDAALDVIASDAGLGSRARRLDALADLLGRATADEQQWLRALIGRDLRQGALAGIVVQAIARAASVPDAAVRRATMLRADLGAVAAAALERGEEGLAYFRLELFQPLEPMLAQTAGDVATVVTELGRAAIEAKLDGARIQVHRDGERVAIYTRNLREVTGRLPEVVALVLDMPAQRLVLDGEVVSHRDDGRPQPFQVTMSRFGRETDEPSSGRTMWPAFFDLLHLDGEDLLDHPLEERIAALARVVPPHLRVDHLVVDDPAAASTFEAETLGRGHEGVMVKALDAPYEAGRRGAAWRKVKPVLTLDLVVLAAEWGSGRRRGWLSNLHLGARDPESGGFVMLGKTFKGLTDETLGWQTEELLAREVRRDGITVYVRPELVVEIALDGVQTSTRYEGGLALRFARVKGYRPDRSADDADTIDAVRAIHVRTFG